MVPNEPRLSIVVPVLGTVDELERSLISVLQCRDKSTEVLLAFNRPYDDPYALEDEVRFVHVPPKSSWADCANQAIGECRAPIVHLLACGTTVEEGWTDHVLPHFDDPQVATVTPLVVEAEAADVVRSAGVAYELGGRRRVLGRGESADQIEAQNIKPIGPTFVAGFYRRELFHDGQGFSSRVGDLLTDVDLALRCAQAGYRGVLEPSCRVSMEGMPTHGAGTWTSGRYAERLFRRHALQHGWLNSLARHALVVAGEMWPRLPLGTSVGRILGRASTWLSVEPAVVAMNPAVTSCDEPITLPFDRGIETAGNPDAPVPTRRSA